MSSAHDTPNRELDEQLADFTDRILLDGEEPAWPEIAMNEPELVELEKTVLRMKNAVHAARPDAATSQRIRAHLLSEWKKPRATSFFGWTRSRLTFAGGLAVGVVLTGTGLLLNLSGSQLTGAAAGELDWTPLFIILGLVLIGILLWNRYHK